MATIRLEVVTAEKVVLSQEVDVVVAPGMEGELGILPHHTPLMTMLQPGILRYRKENKEEELVVTGGFLEVRPDKVVVLADACERAEEIDIARAEAARRRAEERLKAAGTDMDLARAEAALRRSLVRLRVGQRRRREGPRSSSSSAP
ncbi:MAG: F0F1 ATP synthase subunit epsilon [Chloroflexi bacterium]|nr:F0F1 ATP synthase subunit epsilon [Chloroflexota bacterium]